MISLLLLALVYGCGARVPYPAAHPFEVQRKMQAARHWAILAEDVSLQIKTGLDSVPELADSSIFVVAKTASPFEEIFHEMLVSGLVSRGIHVADSQDGALKLDYTARLLEHSDRAYQKVPYKFTLIGTGIRVARDLTSWFVQDVLSIGAGLTMDVAQSYNANPPSSNEVIITTALSKNDSFLIHQTDIYYINDPDASHYETYEAAKKDRVSRYGRKFDVVD